MVQHELKGGGRWEGVLQLSCSALLVPTPETFQDYPLPTEAGRKWNNGKLLLPGKRKKNEMMVDSVQ